MSRVGIDLDGVCYDFAASVATYLDRPHPNPQHWEFYEDWGMSLDDFLATCHAGVDAGVIFAHGDPFEGTRDAMYRMVDAGHTLHIVTDRSFGLNGASEAATRAWLDRHGLPFNSLTFSSDKTVVHLDTMIDDKPANYDALDAAGVDVWLMDRPWNQHHTGRRVHSLHDFANKVIEHAFI